MKATIASLVAAGAITGGLAAQMATGHDPVIGSGADDATSGSTSTQSPEPRLAPVVTAAS